jgi:8-oxo-dGTP diphosphatase
MPTPPRSLDVVAAVIADGDGILACRRAPHKDAAGKWEFPGGKVDPGELPEAALAREIGEELEVDIAVGSLILDTSMLVGEVLIRLRCFRAQLAGERPTRSSDHDQLLWLDPRELAGLDWAEPDIPTVQLLVAAAG